MAGENNNNVNQFDENKTYVSDQLSQAELENAQKSSKFQKKSKMGNVVSIIKELRAGENTYELSDKIRTSPSQDVRTTRLHYSRGTELADREGRNVLEFDIAGSGFRHLRADHKQLKGNRPFIGFFKNLWRNIKKTFSKNKTISQSEMTKKEQAVEAAFGENYQQVDEKGTRLKHVRSRTKTKELGNNQTVTKKKITMAGPMAKGLNRGDYSIHNLRKYVQYMGGEYLKPIFDEAIRQKKTPEDVHVILKGHSRGAVAVAEGAMMLKQWVNENYPQFEEAVKFEVIQYEPVAGLGSNHGLNAEVDHLSPNATVTQSKDVMRPLGPSAETTVMYSVHSNRGNTTFTPQIVKGAKRVIITPMEHSSGFKGFDSSQADGNHKFAYMDASTGEMYRGSAISELPPGVYMMDESNTMIRMRNEKEVNTVIDRLVARIPKGDQQTARYEAIKSSAASWFENEKIKEISKPEIQKEELKKTEFVMDDMERGGM